MDQSDKNNLEERIHKLELHVDFLNRQIRNLSEQLMGAITILCLPMSTSGKLEIGFRMIEKLPDDTLKVIIKKYVEEGKKSDLTFDGMVDPMVRILGFERLWKILDVETIRQYYGEWALARWQEIAKNHQCEGEK